MPIEYDERWLQGKILVWMNEAIKERNLPFECVEQEIRIETPSGHRRYPDLVVWYKRGIKAACLIELKRPIFDPYDEELVDTALMKATSAGIPFFATWNVNKLVLWETFRPGTDLLDRSLMHKDVTDIKRIAEVAERREIEAQLKKFCGDFLEELWKYYKEKLPRPEVYVLPKLYPDDKMIYRLRTAVEALYIPMSDYLMRRKSQDIDFYKEILDWFARQGWIFQDSEEDYDRIARQAIYLLINKLLFYNVLRSKFHLAPIDVSDVTTGEELKTRLQEYFNIGIRMGYGIIFAADFLEKLPIPDEIVDYLKSLITFLNKYDFSELGFDIIGRIFEKLIPREERHKLGQYFTRSDVVDLILGFTIKRPDAKVMDGACGAGTFLVRAYYRKKYLAKKLHKEGLYPKPDKSHEELLKELIGNDVAKFPAHLAMINLIIRKLDAEENKPKIFERDFFELKPEKKTMLYELAYKVPGIKEEELKEEVPYVDVFVTNPPYTRQEEMEHRFLKGYKERLRNLIKRELGVEVGGRSSIYVHFFVYSSTFVRPESQKGRIGLITSNSWLDVDYGKHLQEFFLNRFKIIAIIESKVERWFEDADIITAITILEKCENESERENHYVKFVQLKKPLRHFIPATSEEDERWRAIDAFVDLIENCQEKLKFEEVEFLGFKILVYEDDELRIVLVRQRDLYEEGYDEEQNKYVGAKWGKYIRAPKIFFTILEKGKELFIPLKDVANIRFGIKTGANKFFYLTQDKIRELKLEREFWMHPVTRKEWERIKDKISPKDIYMDERGEYFIKSQYALEYELEELLVNGNVVWIPNYVVRSAQECDSVVVEPANLRYRVLLVLKDKSELKGKSVLKYIEQGEAKGYHRRPTCASRRPWYRLPRLRADVLSLRFIDMTFRFPLNIPNAYVGDTFFCLNFSDEAQALLLSAYLNSTLAILFVETLGRTVMGQGVLLFYGPELNRMPTIPPEKLGLFENELKAALFKLATRKISSIFEEVGADKPEEVCLNKVKSDRRTLDKIIMGEILGLSEEEQLEVYKAIIDLVKNRIERARSVKRQKRDRGVNVDSIADVVLSSLNTRIGRFPEDYLPSGQEDLECEEFTFPRGHNIRIGTDLNGVFIQIDGSEVYRDWDQTKAKYIYYALLNGKLAVRIPKDKKILEETVSKFEGDLSALKKELDYLLSELVTDAKVRKEVKKVVMNRVFSLHYAKST